MAAKNKSIKVIYESPSQTHVATVSLTEDGMPLRQVLREAAADLGVPHPEKNSVLVNNHNYGLDTMVSAGDTVSVVHK